MKKIFIIILLFVGGHVNVYSQLKFCADSSIRIKYHFNQRNFQLFNNYDTTGKNIFAGVAPQTTNQLASIIVFKTSWGDSIFWVKKFYINNILATCFNTFDAPNGSIVGSGTWGSSSDLLLFRIDTNGNMLWAKRYRLNQSHNEYNTGNNRYKNILVTDNAIYFTAVFGTNGIPMNTVCKLDLNGNIQWSKAFRKNSLLIENTVSDAPVLRKDSVFILSNISEYNNITGLIIARYPVITKIQDADGSILNNNAYKTIPDNAIKAIVPSYIKLNYDSTFSLTGSMSIALSNGDLSSGSNLSFNLFLDNFISPLNGFYYKSNVTLNLDQYFDFDFNNKRQSTFLYSSVFNNDKYFISFDKNNIITRSRKFLLPPTGAQRSSINFDDKKNIHFTYNYEQNNKSVVEYARISDLTPANTVSCFGVDTSILEPAPFTLTKEPFVWDVEYTNLVTSFPVNLIEESETITKEVICKQVSYCDSLKIKGSAAICLSGNTARYSVYQNPECLKSINWQTDTTLATIISNEADTAVTLRFKKTGQFYLKAAVNNCVVADSMLVTVTAPQTNLQLNKDSLLCPGSSLLLSVNPLFKTYQWQDGSTQNSFTVTSPGLYHITATDSCGNVIKDSIRVSLVDTSFNIPNAYTFCEYDTARVLLPANIININWQPSVSGILNGNRLLLYPQQPTIYNITAQRPPGCSMKKTITVARENCPEWVRFPSAFTPNGDGLNDNYQPIVSGQIANFSLKIFNRAGQLIFSSNNPSIAWSGRYKGIIQPTGLYVFFCNYRFINGTEKTTKGTIMLLR